MTWIGLNVDKSSLQLPEEATVAPEELHLTLSYLGQAELSNREFTDLCDGAVEIATGYGPGPIEATVAGYGVLGDAKALVLFVTSDEIAGMHSDLMDSMDLDSYHKQFRPWLSHITVSFEGLPRVWLDEMIGKTILLDKVTVHHADEVFEFDI